MDSQAAGWYPDPSGDATKIRYWDGAAWTADFAAAPGQTVATPGFAAEATPGVSVQSEQPQFAGVNTSASYSPDGQAGYGSVYAEYGDASYPYGAEPVYAQNDNKQTLRMVAFIFNIISLVTIGWAILPLAWMIPMTIMSWNIYKGKRPNTVAFGVCTLLFVSLVGGILLLVSGEDRQQYPY